MVDVADVGLHGAFGVVEFVGDFGVREPRGDQFDHLALPVAQQGQI